jgi:predicted AlkP superfamily phosphohydrolase/phosphomutase
MTRGAKLRQGGGRLGGTGRTASGTSDARRRFSAWVGVGLLLIWLVVFPRENADAPAGVHQAYIGPGAGIALVGSFLAVLVAMFSALLALATWPIRWVWRAVRGRRALRRAKVRRVVILGLDGLEPTLVDRFLAEGLLPNLAKLRDQGTYARLGTTWPPLSPVAWSSFSTGTNPGKHNIFDFIMRNPADYRPMISSVRIRHSRRRLRLGKWCIPLSRTRIENLRKSKAFWSLLGDAGVFSAVLRVPITFPPEKFHGVQLSAMSVPDLRGTQGTFSYFCEGDEGGIATEGDIHGERIAVRRNGRSVEARLPGPENPLRRDASTTCVPLKVIRGRNGRATLHIAGQTIPLPAGQFTPWVRVKFSLAPAVKVSAVCQFFLKRFETPFEMYCTPLHIDPGKPVMPISHPHVYSIYLAKQFGPYATLGLAEDTGSLSEGLMSEEAFLRQAYDIDDERQRMFFDALDRVRRGMVACVFDAPDRIQHMFWRFQDERHPARTGPTSDDPANCQAIRDMYVRMDRLVGRTMAAIHRDDALLVMSDHGFKPFRCGVDLNAWLLANGYLKLKGDKRTSEGAYLADVDWSRTRAYGIGLAGIYINQRGRESEGIVAPGEEKQKLVRQLCAELTGLRDPRHDEEAIREAVAREDVYVGPYVEAAPDVIVGYQVGYRVSWGAATGSCGPEVFPENTKAWSGDHCIHPLLVPGVLLSNLRLRTDGANIIDLAPTTLELLGVRKPAFMDGRSLLCNDATSSS